MSTAKPQVNISYKRGGKSGEVARELHRLLTDRGYDVLFDDEDLHYTERIKEFEQRIGEGAYVVLIISDGYLRSEHCMYELVCTYQNHKSDFNRKVFPVVFGDATLFDDKRYRYISYWSNVLHRRNAQRNVSDHTVEKELFHLEEIDLYCGKVTAELKNLRCFTADSDAGFDISELVSTLRKRIDADTMLVSGEETDRLPGCNRENIPFFADRNKQKMCFITYRDFFLKESDRSFIAFLYGPRNECHEGFLKRLRFDILPSYSDFKDDKCLKEEKRIDWPKATVKGAVESHLRSLIVELICALGGTGTGIDGLLQAIRNYGEPALCIRFNLSFKTWDTREATLVERMVALWDELSSHSTGKRILLFFCFRYTPRKKTFFRIRSVEKEVDHFVEHFPFEQYRNICGMSFPRLHSPEFDELDSYIEKWGTEIAGSEMACREMLENLYSADPRREKLPMDTISRAVFKCMNKQVI